jgi:phosphoglycolate phosphatase-like HAD superfamily hydrolase
MPKFNTAVCFDWDGTIIDSMNDKFENFITAIIKAFGFDSLNIEILPALRNLIDFCHKEYGGELRVYQFDNVVNSLSHPMDLLRVIRLLRDHPDQLKNSSYIRERHMYTNFQEELEGNTSGDFLEWVRSIGKILENFMNTEDSPLDRFRHLPNRKKCFDIFNQEYTNLNTQSSKKWKPFDSAEKVLEEIAVENDLFVVSSLLTPLLSEEVKNYHFADKIISCFGGDKTENLNHVKTLGYQRIVFVGDMPADRSAAVKNGADFYRIHPGKDRGNNDWEKMIRVLNLSVNWKL